MGDVSVIARRLSDQWVQYGWSGNGGYFQTVGRRLMTWYNTPDMVDYLFSLGQLRHLWEPYSEKSTRNFRTMPDGLPHWVDKSERWMFSRIAFVDVGYFYDADQVWYLVNPGPFRLKIPLTLVAGNLDDDDHEYSFLEQVKHAVLEEIFSPRRREWLKNSGLDPETLRGIHDGLTRENSPLYQLWEKHKAIFNCFDDWVLVQPDESGSHIGEIILRPKEEPRMETILWRERGE